MLRGPVSGALRARGASSPCSFVPPCLRGDPVPCPPSPPCSSPDLEPHACPHAQLVHADVAPGEQPLPRIPDEDLLVSIPEIQHERAALHDDAASGAQHGL